VTCFPGKASNRTDHLSGVSDVLENSKMIDILNRLKSRGLWVFPLLLGIGLIILVIKGQQEIQKMNQLAQKREALILFNHDLNRKNEGMYHEISRLKLDPIYLEEIARKEFGLVKPDEIIFFLNEANIKEAPSHVTASKFNHP
jgi:cell division protein FtsB